MATGDSYASCSQGPDPGLAVSGRFSGNALVVNQPSCLRTARAGTTLYLMQHMCLTDGSLGPGPGSTCCARVDTGEHRVQLPEGVSLRVRVCVPGPLGISLSDDGNISEQLPLTCPILSQRLPCVSLESPGTAPHSHWTGQRTGVKAVPKVRSGVSDGGHVRAPPTMTVSPPLAVRELWSREEPSTWRVPRVLVRCPRKVWGPSVGSTLD